jgi:hypothetical protein
MAGDPSRRVICREEGGGRVNDTVVLACGHVIYTSPWGRYHDAKTLGCMRCGRGEPVSEEDVRRRAEIEAWARRRKHDREALGAVTEPPDPAAVEGAPEEPPSLIEPDEPRVTVAPAPARLAAGRRRWDPRGWFRRPPVTVLAIMRYEGDFDLSFLMAGERVQASDTGPGSCEVITPRGSLDCQVGDFLVRLGDGRLGRYHPVAASSSDQTVPDGR